MEAIYIFTFFVSISIIITLIRNLYNFIKNHKKIKAENYNQYKEINGLKSQIKDLEVRLNSLDNEILLKKESHKKNTRKLENKISELRQAIKLKDEFYNSLKNKTNESVSKITSLYSDLLLVQYSISQEFLEKKKHPAIVEAKRINELKKETKLYIQKYRQMVYIYETLLNLFPELNYYVEDFETLQLLENTNSLNEFVEDFDKVQFYINKDEYQKLDEQERNQLALDRYISGQKTKWQIGRDYELFCGSEYEKEGWIVEYIGIEKKLEDLGRDLIASKGNEIHIVQCKYWSQNKIIHEKHIAQLFGTTIAFRIKNNNLWDVKPVFITNIELSQTAIEFARLLEVSVIKKELGEFPRIKCNYGKNDRGEETKIYHLPFDQQYDNIKMNRKGNFFAYSVKEAMDRGFRRAYKYYG